MEKTGRLPVRAFRAYQVGRIARDQGWIDLKGSGDRLAIEVAEFSVRQSEPRSRRGSAEASGNRDGAGIPWNAHDDHHCQSGRAEENPPQPHRNVASHVQNVAPFILNYGHLNYGHV